MNAVKVIAVIFAWIVILAFLASIIVILGTFPLAFVMGGLFG